MSQAAIEHYTARAPIAQLRRATADAELLGLGRQFEPLLRTWTRRMTADQQARFKCEIAAEKLTGIKRANVAALPQDQANAYWATRRRAGLAPRLDSDFCDNGAMAALTGRLDDLVADILSCEAITREGLAIQIKAAIYHYHEATAPTFEWEGEAEDENMRRFLASLASFIGVAFPAFETHVSMLIERDN
jgi:hypothetical protein